MIDFNYIN